MEKTHHHQNPKRGTAEPDDTTVCTKVGKARYRGIEPAVKMIKVLLLPIQSDTAAQPNLPPKLPAESIITNFAAKAEVATVGSTAEKTSLIIGLATLNIPMPPVARQKKVNPNRWNCGAFMASSNETSLMGAGAAVAVVVVTELAAATALAPPGTKEGCGLRMVRLEANMMAK